MRGAVTPYNKESTGKKKQVAEMFDNIAGNYDFLNHFLSLGIDILWRRKAIRLLRKHQPKTILDIATGTGDFAIEALKLNPDKITGIDISEKMLEIGKIKIEKIMATGKIELRYGDSENLSFYDGHFDAITIGFGIRNFENLQKGLSEISRVMKQNGRLVILEFSKPQRFPVKQIYQLYFFHILPFIGKLVSKDSRAYSYLPESVEAFPDGKEFLALLKESGFKDARQILLSFGIASIYLASK